MVMKDDMNRMNKSENTVNFPPSWVRVEPLTVLHQECCFFKPVGEGENLFSLLTH